jgi:hypothetical protein
MRELQAFIFVSALACAPATLAQEATITVNISAISADLATKLDVDESELPTTVSLSPAAAAIVCGVDVSTLVNTCVAVTTTVELTTQVQRELNSAAEFAPGQEEGDAKDFAPGQQDDGY